ncbi:hypothetical protein UPYG_G00082000, partial [Umbra pygmaea]
MSEETVIYLKRVAIALWKLVNGSEYRSVGYLFGKTITTVCRFVQDLFAAADTLLVQEKKLFELVKSMLMTCCALHNLCESHGEAYDNEWDAAVAAEHNLVPLAQGVGVEEEGRDAQETLMRYLNTPQQFCLSRYNNLTYCELYGQIFCTT